MYDRSIDKGLPVLEEQARKSNSLYRRYCKPAVHETDYESIDIELDKVLDRQIGGSPTS